MSLCSKHCMPTPIVDCLDYSLPAIFPRREHNIRSTTSSRHTRRNASKFGSRLVTGAASIVAELQAPMENTFQEPERKHLPLEAGSLVLVAGSTGGVGQLLTARLLDHGFRVRAVTRSLPHAEDLFSGHSSNLELVKCDFRKAEAIPEVLDGVDAICSCLGTTAFPSKRWDDNNNPEMTDKVANGNLIKTASENGKRFVLVSSVGVSRTNQIPYSILNLFDVLTFRRMSEKNLIASGLPYTIVRPCRLTDGPYTSYDLNTLIKGTRGGRRSVKISENDDLSGEASRIVVAEAIVQCLLLPTTVNHTYSLQSVNDGSTPPEEDTEKWEGLFAAHS